VKINYCIIAIELRRHIIEQLSHINNNSYLAAIMTIDESKVNEGAYKLSDFQKIRIESGREQLRNGHSISRDVLQKEIEQWLNTK
jgi:disulfide oxidoreductase YuzD